MPLNPVRQKLLAGGTTYGVTATEFLTPGFSQIAANAGAEFVMFDMEHGAVGIDVLRAQMAFARAAGVAPLVRVPATAHHLIAPVVDAGAMGIMAPMVETPERPELLANSCRYRPEGLRGVGFGYSHDDYRGGDVVAAMRAENQPVLVVEVAENAKGVQNADAIAGVPGVDVGWLEHFDLTDSMGITAQFNRQEFHAAVDALFSACRNHGKAPEFLAVSVEHASEWLAKGVRCLCYDPGVGVYQAALSLALQTLRVNPARK